MSAAKKKRAPSRPPIGGSFNTNRDRKLTTFVVIALVVLVWVAFGNSLGNEFVNYDDGDYVYENPIVSQGLTLSGIGGAFTHFHAANWHPLTTISHMVDCQIYGLQPWGHHLTNVLLHALAAILLFLALRRLTEKSLNSQLSTLSSAFVAALFAIHPLHVESVVWISERKDVLSGVFCMLTILAYARYAQSKGRNIGKYLLVVSAFALGLMCKPTLVTLPFVLLLLDYWPLQRMRSAWSKEPGASSEREENKSAFQLFSVSALVFEKLPLFALSAVSCVITFVAQQQALERTANLNLFQRLSNAAVSYVIYLGQLVYPVHLTASYPYGPIRAGEVILAVALLALITAIFILLRKTYPFLLTGWLWYLGVLVPMIGLVQVGLQPRADRYTYLSHIGLYVIVVFGVAALMPRLRAGKPVIAVIAVGVLATLISITRMQAGYWHDSETLWRHAIEVTSNNYMAHNDLGTILLRENRPEAALVELRQAMELAPNFESPFVSAGSACMLMGHFDEAIGYYQKALQIHPSSAEDVSNLATALLKQGKSEEAIADYRKAVEFKPASAEMHYNLGHALAEIGRWADAIPSYRSALQLRPRDPKFHNNLAVALIRTATMDEALEELHRALEANPNYVEAHYNLGCLLISLNRRQDAVVHFTEVERLNPNYADTRERLRELGAPVAN